MVAQPIKEIERKNPKRYPKVRKNLKYALKNECLPNLYYGTLNESISDEFQINISHGSILVYQNHSN